LPLSICPDEHPRDDETYHETVESLVALLVSDPALIITAGRILTRYSKPVEPEHLGRSLESIRWRPGVNIASIPLFKDAIKDLYSTTNQAALNSRRTGVVQGLIEQAGPMMVRRARPSCSLESIIQLVEDDLDEEVNLDVIFSNGTAEPSRIEGHECKANLDSIIRYGALRDPDGEHGRKLRAMFRMLNLLRSRISQVEIGYSSLITPEKRREITDKLKGAGFKGLFVVDRTALRYYLE